MTDWVKLPTTSGTALHRALADSLSALGFYVENEVAVGRYHVDCYVRELHLAFEADGPHHRRMASDKRRDAERDMWLETEAALPVMRPAIPFEAGTLLQWIDGWRHSAEDRRRIAESKGYAP